jgi:hypothetical protein
MDEDKYEAAIELIVHKHSVPNFIYQKTVVSKDQKEIVRGLRERIIDISTSTEPGNNNVFIPFENAIKESLAKKRSSDMMIANRIVGF